VTTTVVFFKISKIRRHSLSFFTRRTGGTEIGAEGLVATSTLTLEGDLLGTDLRCSAAPCEIFFVASCPPIAPNRDTMSAT
jgi:hypothetical protein